MSKTRFVAFATQKGGIGKSPITALVANYFHNVKGYNVAGINLYEPQSVSFTPLRAHATDT